MAAGLAGGDRGTKVLPAHCYIFPSCLVQYFDYWQCIDKCAAPKLFATLK